MNIIVNHSSMQPIYEQIAEQIKAQIIQGELLSGDALPSVRLLAKEQEISALTVKKSYDFLEKEGFIVTVHGKGSFVSAVKEPFIQEVRRREVEGCMEHAVQTGKKYGMTDAELRELLELLLAPIEA